MMIFIAIVVVAALVMQLVLLRNGLEYVEADHRPDVQVAEPDEPFHLDVFLRNKTRRFVPFLQVKEFFDEGITPLNGGVPGGVVKGYHVSFTAWLRPGQRMKRPISLSVSQRGRYVLRPFQLYSGDFLGLRERSKDCGRFTELIVAPKPFPNQAISEVFGGFMGDVSVTRFIMEDPVLTLGYREYTGREPMKMISWTQSARGNGLMVKKYDYTLEPTVSVLLNVEVGLGREPLVEDCFSLARTVCTMLEQKGVKYRFTSNCELAGMSSFPDAGAEGLGWHHFQGILEHLGRATYTPRISFTRMLEQEAHRGSATGRILITPGVEHEPIQAINRLRESAGGNLLIIRASEVQHDFA